MADVFYETSPLVYYHLFQPQTLPQNHHPPSPFVQILLTIRHTVTFIDHDCITGSFTDSINEPLVSQETLLFNLDVLKNQNQVHQIIVPALVRVGIIPTSLSTHIFIDKLIQLGFRMANCTLNSGRKVLPLRADLWGTITVHINNQEVSINRALSESASEFEARNYDMVPAKESSVKKMLEKVSGEVGDEDCMICLEELKVGSESSDVSRMPCSHTFHANCIEKWLKQSHYCPICRFEMPT
ncbi:hypothetical protein CRYUN_Cryun29cG0103200 [Craigia yunnanensis]